jgi:restriction system protein
MPNTVTCSKCKTRFDADNKESVSRLQCPNCGSTAQDITLEVNDAIHVTVGMDAILTVSSNADILLQTVVIRGEQTSEGQIIQAVTVPWFDIIDLLKKNPDIAFQIGYEKWEEIIAGAYRKAGFDEVILTPRSGDHGRDIIATKKGIGTVRVIDQVKAYSKGHLVTADHVRALMGVIIADRSSKGFLTTTSDFAPKLTEDPLIKEFIPHKLGLINGAALRSRLIELRGLTE